MPAIKIVVTGDDFGKSDDVNAKIVFCHQAGILSSASLVANGQAFEQAAEIAATNPTLGIGVHLAIDDFEPLCREPSSIVNSKTNMFYSHEAAIKKIKTLKYRTEDLVKEYSWQIEKVLDFGISIDHLNHHHHFHLYWPVLNAIIKVAKRYNIRYIRSEKLLPPKWKRFHKNIYRLGHQMYLKSRHATADGYFEFVHDDFPRMYESLKKLVNSNYRIVEVVVHPSREKEYEVSFLTNESVINLARMCNLVNFGNI